MRFHESQSNKFATSITAIDTEQVFYDLPIQLVRSEFLLLKKKFVVFVVYFFSFGFASRRTRRFRLMGSWFCLAKEDILSELRYQWAFVALYLPVLKEKVVLFFLFDPVKCWAMARRNRSIQSLAEEIVEA